MRLCMILLHSSHWFRNNAVRFCSICLLNKQQSRKEIDIKLQPTVIFPPDAITFEEKALC